MDNLSRILEKCSSAIGSVDPALRNELIGAILSSRKVFIYGSGRSGLVGQLFAVRLVQLGLDVHFVGEMTTPIIGKDDLTLLISNTGRTSSVVQTAKIAKRIGSKIVSITGKKECELNKASDIRIVFDIDHDGNIGETAPLGTLFEDSALLFFDCIVCDIMSKEGISEDDMRKRHAIWV